MKEAWYNIPEDYFIKHQDSLPKRLHDVLCVMIMFSVITYFVFLYFGYLLLLLLLLLVVVVVVVVVVVLVLLLLSLSLLSFIQSVCFPASPHFHSVSPVTSVFTLDLSQYTPLSAKCQTYVRIRDGEPRVGDSG